MDHRLEPLAFENAQLHEATRCWLYGFYRASIVLAASAAEDILKKAANKALFKKYDELVNEAVKLNKISNAEAALAKDVFRVRNRVVHEAWKPESKDAEDLLAWARGVAG